MRLHALAATLAATSMVACVPSAHTVAPAATRPLHLDWTPPSATEGRIALRLVADTLELLPEGAAQPIRLAPWPLPLPRCADCRYVLATQHLPDGPAWRLEVRDGAVPELALGVGSRVNAPVAGGWRVARGEPGAAVLSLVRGDVSLRAAAGERSTLAMPEGDWVLMVISARARTSPSPAAPSGTVSDEQPDFAADWVAVREAVLH